MVKSKVVEALKLNVSDLYDEVFSKVSRHGEHIANVCLYWAFYTMQALKLRGINACIQAGDCVWPRINRAEWDKVPNEEMTHFGYVWDPDSLESSIAMAIGHLPEMHIWVGLPDVQEVVDFTTGFFPANCKLMLGKDWPGDKPPQYFWWPVQEALDEYANYRPRVSACVLAYYLIKEITAGDQLEPDLLPDHGYAALSFLKMLKAKAGGLDDAHVLAATGG